jgi:hypothetical protein
MEDFNFMFAHWVKAKYKRFRKKPVYLAYKWLGRIAVLELMFSTGKGEVHPKSGKYLRV